jgi:hypothetical protein
MEGIIDWFINFNLWTTNHYFAFKNRNKYPNMFFFYFSKQGTVVPNLSKKEIKLFINYSRAERRNISGMWGFISLKFSDKSGLALYKAIAKTDYMRPEYSFPCYQMASPFSKELEVFYIKNKELFKESLIENESLFSRIEYQFEEYLRKDIPKREIFMNILNDDGNLLARNRKTCLEVLRNESLVNTSKPLNHSNLIIESKRKLIITDDMDEMDEDINQVKQKKIAKVVLEYDFESSFAAQSDSDSDFEIGILASTKCCSLRPDFIVCEGKLNGYFSDYTRKVYKFERDGYSDQENKISYRTNAIIKKESKHNRVRIHDTIKHLSPNQLFQIVTKITRRRKYTKIKGPNKTKKRKHKDTKEVKSKPKISTSKRMKSISNITNWSLSDNISRDDRSIVSGYSDTSFTNKQLYTQHLLSHFSTSNKHVNSLTPNYNLRNKRHKQTTVDVFYPQVSNINKTKENEVVKKLSKLISNDKFTSLQQLLTERRSEFNKVYSMIISSSSYLTTKEINIYNNELLEQIQEKENVFNIDNKSIDFSQKNSIKSLFEIYTYNLTTLVRSIIKDNKYEILANEEVVINNLKKCENLLKYAVKNYDIFFKDVNVLSLIQNEYKEILYLFIEKMFKEESELNAILIEITIERLVTFLIIIQVVYNNSSAIMHKDTINSFLKILVLFVLARMYNYNVHKPDAEGLIYFTLFNIIAEVYATINKIEANNFETIVELFLSVIKGFLYPGSAISKDDIPNDFENNFLNMIKNYFKGNYLDKNSFEKGLKGSLFKVFLLKCLQITCLNDLSTDLKRLLFNPIYIQIYHRYLTTMLLVYFDTKFELTKTDLFEYLYESTILSTNNSYYDIESIVRQTDNNGFRRILCNDLDMQRRNIMFKYLLSDSAMIILLNEKWEIDKLQIYKLIFSLFKSITQQNRKNILVNEQLKKEYILKLLDIIYKDNEDNSINELPDLIRFIYNITKVIRHVLKLGNDEGSRKRNFSKINSLINSNKSVFEGANENSTKLALLPVLSIILVLILFSNSLEDVTLIKSSITKIGDIFELSKASAILKNFNLAILLRIVKKLSSKKQDVTHYIGLINELIKNILQNIKELDKLPNVGNNQNIQRECVDSLEFFLRDIKSITNEDVNLLILHKSILEQVKEILVVDNQFAIHHKRKVIELLNCVFDDFEKSLGTKKENYVIIGEDDEAIELPSEFLDMLDDTVNYKDRLTDYHRSFLEVINNSYITLVRNLIYSYFDNKNTNKHKIPNDLLCSSSELYAKMTAIFVKYHNPSKLSFYIDYILLNTSFLSNTISKYLFSTNHKDIVELLTLIPFKCLNIFLTIYPDIFTYILNNKNYNEIKRFIEYFIYALFYKKKNLVYTSLYSNKNNLNDCDLYIVNLIGSLEKVSKTIENQLEIYKRDYNKNSKFIDDVSVHNILLMIIRNYDVFRNIISNFKSFNLFTDMIINKLTLQKNLDKINICTFLRLFDRVRLDEIIYRSKTLSDIYDDYNILVFEFFYKIISQYSETILTDKNYEGFAMFINTQLKTNLPLFDKLKIIDNDLTLFYTIIKSPIHIEKYKSILHEVLNYACRQNRTTYNKDT